MAPIRIFIVSSSKALGIAENLRDVLNEDHGNYCEVEVWTSVFPMNMSEPFMQILQNVAKEFDFAIIILTPDNKTLTNGRKYNVANSNVVLEMGLFIGSWGLNRVLLVEIDSAALNIGDLRSIQEARLHLTGSYEIPEDSDSLEAYNTSMRDALRKDVSPRLKSMLDRSGRRGLSAPLDRIVQTTRELERLYRHGNTVDDLFLKHLGRHMETFHRGRLNTAGDGEVELISAEEAALVDILAAAKHSAKAVAHYTNIEWWTDKHRARRYIEVHEQLLNRNVKIQRVFLLPVMSLRQRKVQRAIEISCRLGVEAKLLLWQTDDMEPQIKLGRKTHKTEDISYSLDRYRGHYPSLPGWSRTFDGELSFLIVDDEVVSYSNIPAPDRETPSLLFTNLPEKNLHSPSVQDVIDIFDDFYRHAKPAEWFFPSYC